MAHHHHHSAPSYGRLFAIGISLNLTYVSLEAFYGWKIGSLALLADAGHNLSDVAGLILAWIGAAASQLKPNSRYTFGWKKTSIFASLINACLLLFAMGYLAIEAITRFNTPTQLQAGTIIWVAGFGVIINGITAWLFIKGSKKDLNIKGAFLHMAADTLVSLAVVISGVIYLKWQFAWLDPTMSLLVAAIVVIGTWSLFKNTLQLMFDGVPENVDMPSIVKYLNAHPAISSFHDLHIRALSTSENSLSVHLVKREASLNDDTILQEVTTTIQNKFHVSHVTVQIENLEYSINCPSIHCTDN